MTLAAAWPSSCAGSDRNDLDRLWKTLRRSAPPVKSRNVRMSGCGTTRKHLRGKINSAY
jgi:hypothetical protein